MVSHMMPHVHCLVMEDHYLVTWSWDSPSIFIHITYTDSDWLELPCLTRLYGRPYLCKILHFYTRTNNNQSFAPIIFFSCIPLHAFPVIVSLCAGLTMSDVFHNVPPRTWRRWLHYSLKPKTTFELEHPSQKDNAWTTHQQLIRFHYITLSCLLLP